MPPARVIFAATQQFPLVDVTSDISVELRLEWLLKALAAYRKWNVGGMQTADDFQLIQMMFQPVVRLADENDLVVCQSGQHLGELGQPL